MPIPTTDKFRDVSLNVLRIMAGLLFLQHGAQKLFGWFGGMDGSGATADLVSLMGAAGVIEFFGGLLIALGLFTVPVAAIGVLEMLVAYGMAHLPQGLVPIQNQGELPLLYAAIFLLLVAHGSGSFSLDAVLGGGREQPASPSTVGQPGAPAGG